MRLSFMFLLCYFALSACSKEVERADTDGLARTPAPMWTAESLAPKPAAGAPVALDSAPPPAGRYVLILDQGRALSDSSTAIAHLEDALPWLAFAAAANVRDSLVAFAAHYHPESDPGAELREQGTWSDSLRIFRKSVEKFRCEPLTAASEFVINTQGGYREQRRLRYLCRGPGPARRDTVYEERGAITRCARPTSPYSPWRDNPAACEGAFSEYRTYYVAVQDTLVLGRSCDSRDTYLRVPDE